MNRLDEIWPVLGLSITSGRLELRAIRDDDIPALVELAQAGIHPPDQMPFYVAWSTLPPADLGRDMAGYYWRTRAEFGPQSWTLNLIARWDGEPVGSQSVSTDQYLITRTGETGSWLAASHQGRGIGTAMRRAICEFLFDHLDATEITSGAFTDNPASARVSAKVGYLANGQERRERRPGEMAVADRFRLRPKDLIRAEGALVAHGVGGLRELIGLDRADEDVRPTLD